MTRKRYALATVILCMVLAGSIIQRLSAQPLRPPQVRDSAWPWPAPVHPQARLVTAFPAARGTTLVFQEPSGTVRILRIDQVAPDTEGYVMMTFTPPKR